MTIHADQLNLRHLSAFLAVCDLQSISLASGVVYLSQPAITQAISALEKRFDIQFFTRSSRGMYPTEAASIFANRIERAFQILGETGKRIRKPLLSSQITSTQLRALIAIDTHHNYSIAAKSSNIAQPSLYRTAKELESIVGEVLYLKTPNGIQLSAIAKQLQKSGRLAFAELRQGIDELSLFKGDNPISLTIGCLPLSRGTLLPAALVLLMAEYPKLNVKVVDNSYDIMLNALRNGEIDLMLGALRKEMAVEDVTQVALFEDRLGVYCSPDHPLMAKSDITMEDVSSCSWVVAEKGTPTRSSFDKFVAKMNAVPETIIESSSTVLARALLQKSDCIAMVSKTQMKDDVKAGAIVDIDIDFDDSPRPIGISFRKSWSPTKFQRRLVDILRCEAKKFVK